MKILVALDLSEYGNFVLKKAIKTARQQDAKLDIMVVVEGHNYGSHPLEPESHEQRQLLDAKSAARSYQQKAITLGVMAKVRVRSGKSAAEEIIKYQKSENLDLIVVGRRSHPYRSSIPIGAVAQKVVKCATCTVMVVRCMEKKDIAG